MSKVACICEGNFEMAIIDILLENDCLIFKREQMLEEDVLKCRSGKNFQEKYLNMTMNEQITVYRIIDSRKENFKITAPYLWKIKKIVNVITAPEIEMLILHAEGAYDHYSRTKTSTGLKPSQYVKQHLGMGNIKSYESAYHYFKNVDKLKKAIYQYHTKSNDKENTMYHLILKK